MHAVIQNKKLDAQQVYFGGVYRECWSEDYKLRIAYHERKAVNAVFENGRWVAVSGDDELVSRLKLERADSEYLYFQAAAQVQKTVSASLEMGLPLERVYESFSLRGNPCYAPELVRCLMDDHGLSFDAAFDAAAQSCLELSAEGMAVEEMYSIQPRTAHIISILRNCAADRLTVYHNALLSEYRSPFGAVRCGDELRLAFKLLGGRVERAFVQLWGDDFRAEYPMEAEGDMYISGFKAPEKAQALWYNFRIEGSFGCRWLCPRGNSCTGRVSEMMEGGFRLTVYLRDFETPKWFRNSIMYQIYPDRFAFSDDDTALSGIKYHEKLGQIPELHKSVDEPVRYLPRDFESDYSPDDFYGGTLKGIEKKLPYLKSLGISCIYLNPIVEARSNHRYDCSDYLKVDPILGSNEDFERLAKTAEEMGIRIMLDGVYSHTGADSVYFNRYGNYSEVGACQGESSDYYKWYDFINFPDDYRSWWGFKDLPEVDEMDESWQDFIISGEHSVVKTWLRRGAAGWRLDVADELPDEVLALIRKHSKLVKNDAPILGEVWEDAVIKESYGGRRNYALGYSLDSVMNYPFRNAMLDFIHGRKDAYAVRDFLNSQMMNYPQPMYYSLMNLLGSHDTDRIATAMSTPVVLRGLSREDQLSLYISEESFAHGIVMEKLCAGIQFAIPGVPSIYYGDEQGMQGVNDPFNRMPFKEGNTELRDYYAELCRRRNSEPALLDGAAEFAAAAKDLLLIYRHSDNGSDWIIAANRSALEIDFFVDFGNISLSSTAPAFKASYIEIKKENFVC